MKPDRWQEIERIFNAASDLQPTERKAFLERTCAGDEALLKEVERLLARQQEAEEFIAVPALEMAAREFARGNVSELGRDALPQALQHYHVIEKIGEGGMGVVYRASDTRLNRPVAIKALPDVFAADPERLARFEREARLLASLNHPNIAAVYGLEESGGKRYWNVKGECLPAGAAPGLEEPDAKHYFILELVEGATLAERIASGALGLNEALQVCLQIAEGLEAAHEKGIVHRDLKPDNVKITPKGKVKILDFGLAKAFKVEGTAAASERSLTISEGITQTGVILGTTAYMSPEQAKGRPVDKRADIWAFGCILYECLTGRRAFRRETVTETLAAILREEPDWALLPRNARTEIRNILQRCLQKDLNRRYGSAAEVVRDLRVLKTPPMSAWRVRLSRNAWITVGAAAVLAGVFAGWLWRGALREQWALETATPEITRLIDAGEYVKAATLAREARAVLPKDPTLDKLWMRATGEVSVASVPSGADLSIRPYRGDPNAWVTLGKTPLQKVRVPRDAYLWRLVKPGFAAAFLIGEPPGPVPPGFHSSFDLTLKLRPERSVPPEMVVVAGGRVGLGFPLGQAPAAQVDDFLIDRHEVTNEEYKKFVDAGGYQRREFWKQPFLSEGRAVSWEHAVALFHDATGRPGPATWEVGGYPKGRKNYPVAGVSWYEAAAFAEFVGKSLPTAYHWTRASQSLAYTPLITAGSNFRNEGTRPVGSEAALSGFGTMDMAGNVKEWCLNEARDAKRLILGGGFGEPTYMFNHTDTQSPWERQANFGFRCAKLDSPPAAAAAARIDVTPRDFWKGRPVSDDVLKAYIAVYAYDKGELNAQVEETINADGWSRARATFDAAYGHERVTAYLFLPKNVSPPFQTIVYFPGGFAFSDDKLDLSSVEETRGFLLQSGRALIVPIYKGTYERKDGFWPYNAPPASSRDYVIAWAKDLGRSLDYLEARKDIDSEKVAYFGDSLGAVEGALLPVVEKRIKAAILSSGGFFLTMHYLADADPFNFVSRVTIPVLMLNGRYDSVFPLESSQRPLFHFLGTPADDKKHVIYEGGHGAFPRPAAVRECLDWLDKYLGPVRR